LEDGGVSRAVLDICAALAECGHEMTLLTADATDAPADWQTNSAGRPRVVITPLPPMLGPLNVATEAALGEAEVLHLHGAWDLTNLRLARRAKRLGIPYIVSPHGMLDDWQLRQKWLKKSVFLALLGRRFLAGAAGVHCTAAAELAQAARFFRPGSGVVVPLPIDLAAYTDLPGPELARTEFPQLNDGRFCLLFLSRLHPKKRPELLIAAAAKLEESGQRCGLILAGPGEPAYVSQLQHLARQYGLEKQVLFPGMVRGRLKVSLYQAADAFVLPTSQENFGYVLLEAMASGASVVTTRGVDIWEELQAAGALIADPTPEAFAAALKSLRNDPEAARQRGQQGRAWVFQNLSSDRVIGEYEQMYRRVRPIRSG
jgi:glycosyltransferase involved in cell wall biosynthesis